MAHAFPRVTRFALVGICGIFSGNQPPELVPSHLFEHIQGVFEIALRMRGSYTKPQPSRILGNRWKQHRRSKNAMVTKPSGKQPGGGLVVAG